MPFPYMYVKIMVMNIKEGAKIFYKLDMSQFITNKGIKQICTKVILLILFRII